LLELDVTAGEQIPGHVPASQQYIQASCVGILGREKYARNELLNADTFAPLYLRSADAQIRKA
jgi:hypothetical protein